MLAIPANIEKFAVVNLGCKVNRVESDEVENLFRSFGWTQVKPKEATVVVVNTCAVTGAAEKKTRKTLRGIANLNSGALIIVTGCASALNPDFYKQISNKVSVVPKTELNTYIKNLLFNEFSSVQNFKNQSILQPSIDRFRRGIKIQDGCNNRCTYCVIWKARGPEYSVDLESILNSVSSLASEGVREIILTGINLGKYYSENTNLVLLLEELLSLNHGCRYRISSIEPNNVSDDLIELIASAEGKICRHLHIPLQSGSSKILNMMNRPYTSDEYVSLILKLRNLIPEISISTDIIVGFPGETDVDFESTLCVAKACKFSKIHVFPFSSREQTPASEMLNQISPEVKSRRAQILRRLSDDLRDKDLSSRKGTTEKCIVSGNGLCMSESYHELQIPTQNNGQIEFEIKF